MEVKTVCLAIKTFRNKPHTIRAFESFDAAVLFVEKEVDRYNEVSFPGEKYSVVLSSRALLRSDVDQLLLSEHDKNDSTWVVQRVRWNAVKEHEHQYL